MVLIEALHLSDYIVICYMLQLGNIMFSELFYFTVFMVGFKLTLQILFMNSEAVQLMNIF